MILITGGAGFIGANFVHFWLTENPDDEVIVLDKFTYAGNPENLSQLNARKNLRVVAGDIGNREGLAQLLSESRPQAIVNFAAESHVDRSIEGAADFLDSNVVGTYHLLEAIRGYLDEAPSNFRLLHVSTDEVYGSLEPDAHAFTETHPFQPNSPYAATKAASDHLVRAWHKTYGLPVITTNCSNNYGPMQFPEKLIPVIISNALAGQKLPVYGDGMQVRDWLYVTDHCEALATVLAGGTLGHTYNIGGNNEIANIELVTRLCHALDEVRPRPDATSYTRQIEHVTDRPGHDRRYAVDTRFIKESLGWTPRTLFADGLSKTVDWYLLNPDWAKRIRSGEYRESIENLERL